MGRADSHAYFCPGLRPFGFKTAKTLCGKSVSIAHITTDGPVGCEECRAQIREMLKPFHENPEMASRCEEGMDLLHRMVEFKDQLKALVA